MAAIVSAQDLEQLNQMDLEREQRWAAFGAIGERNADKDPQEVERDVAEAIDELRQEQRAETATTPET